MPAAHGTIEYVLPGSGGGHSEQLAEAGDTEVAREGADLEMQRLPLPRGIAAAPEAPRIRANTRKSGDALHMLLAAARELATDADHRVGGQLGVARPAEAAPRA